MSIVKEQGRYILQNDYLKRVLDLNDGICTRTYHIKPGGDKNKVWYPVFSFEPDSPFEAVVKVNGESYEACPFNREDGRLWDRKGAFKVKDVEVSKGEYGDQLTITLVGSKQPIENIELNIVYEVCGDLPFMSKMITVVNVGSEAVTINNITVDTVRLFNRRLPLTVFTDYYWPADQHDDYYQGWTRFEFPEDINFIVDPGQSVESLKVYEVVTSMDRQEESYFVHRTMKRIAPWIKRLSPSLCVDGCNSIEELHKTIEDAAKNHIEQVSLHVCQVFENIGDYVPRKDLFPNGYADVKQLVAAFHAKGIKVLPYSSTTIAWRGSQVCIDHPDWQYLGPEGIRYSPEAFGNMCYQSPWGEYIKEKLRYLVDEIGFDGLALDGPYHGLPCLDKNHKHQTAEAVKFMNWYWEKQFFAEIVVKGKILLAPQEWNAQLFGISKTPGGYREEDQNEMGGMDLVTMTRACIYESRYETPACGIWGSFNLEAYHGHSIEASEENPATYEHSIAGLFGYGIDGSIFAKSPYIGPKTEAIYHKWLKFFKKYNETLLGEFIHIAQPNGYEPDGVMHANLEADIPAVVIVFNVCDEVMNMCTTLPLKYAGFKGGETAKIDEKTMQLDSAGNVSVDIPLKPYEVKVIEVTRS